VCRIAAYSGPPVTLASLLSDPPHGLVDQSRNAREMHGVSVAGDGWGVGWFAGGDPTRPGTIKSILPLWSDENAKTTPHAIISHSIVGHIRLASPGIEVCFTNTPLYPLGEYLWTVNGELSPWPGPLSKAIRDRLDPEDEAAVRGSTDAELLGALWRTCLRRSRPSDAAGALREALRAARDLAFGHGGTIKVNVIVAHASGFVAVRYAEPDEPNSLYYLSGEPRWHGGAVVASEPLDDGPGWVEVEPSTLVLADSGRLRTEPLGLGDAEGHPGRRRSA
jgi:gamma-glutamyl hercynylcysteine S-oxide hydrolase